MGKDDGRRKGKGRIAFWRLLWAVMLLWGGLLLAAPSFSGVRARLNIHSRRPYAPLCSIFGLYSANAARCVSFVQAQSPTNDGVHLTESYFQARSGQRAAVQEFPWEESHVDPEDYVNPDTGYRVVIEDRAGLLYTEQMQELSQAMRAITAYGNAAFVTVRQNNDSTESFARSYYQDRFGTDSGTVFVIDMEQRNIWIHSDGDVWKVITVANANTITDNVYRYASYGDYYQCAAEAFREIHALLKGKEIPRPMKYISNALFAMILALLVNYMLFINFTRLRKPKAKAVLANINRKFYYRNLDAVYTHQTRVYDPVSGGGSGGHGGGRSGGGGGGGGRSGGGGGHGF